MIGWYVAFAFAALTIVGNLLYLHEHGEHKKAVQQWSKAWDIERKQFLDAIAQLEVERDSLRLQLAEATKPKTRTKKEKAQP